MMDNISIKTKSWITLALFLSTLLFITLISLSLLKETIVHERKAMLVDVTNMAHKIIRQQYALFQSGKLSEESAKQSAITALRNLRMGKSNYVFVYKGGIAILAPENPQNEGKDLINAQDINGLYIGREMSRITKGGKAGFLTYYWYHPGSRVPVEKLSYARGFASWGWYVGSGVYQDDLRSILFGLLKEKVWLLLLSLAAVLTLVAFVFTMNRSSVRRTLKIKAYLETLGKGDFTEQITPVGKDEIGQMMQTLLDVRTRYDNVVRELKQAADSVLTGIQNLSNSNKNLQNRTLGQATELSKINSALQRINDTTKSNVHSIDSAAASASTSRKTVIKGKNAMQDAMAAMEKINQSSEKVTEIITVIDDLAFQTNLLALNAAVEAARAGEQGRGFAVVAAEVRNLAQRSSESAQEIRQLIDQSSSNVRIGTELVNDSGRLLRQILENSDSISNRLAEISAESEKQSQEIEHASRAIEEINGLSQENLTLVEDAASTSLSVKNQTQFMYEKMKFFVLNEKLENKGKGMRNKPFGNTEKKLVTNVAHANSKKRDNVPEQTKRKAATC